MSTETELAAMRAINETLDSLNDAQRARVVTNLMLRYCVPDCRLGSTIRTPPAVTKGDVIRIVPESGPKRLMQVSHVEHHIITLSDLANAEQESDR